MGVDKFIPISLMLAKKFSAPYPHATKMTSMMAKTKTFQDAQVLSIRSNMKINLNCFWEFFYQHDSKLKRQQTKPRWIEEHVKNRLIFANKWNDLLSTATDLYYCFLFGQEIVLYYFLLQKRETSSQSIIWDIRRYTHRVKECYE